MFPREREARLFFEMRTAGARRFGFAWVGGQRDSRLACWPVAAFILILLS